MIFNRFFQRGSHKGCEAAGGWQRTAKLSLTKFKRMNDGELLSLLVERGTVPAEQFDAAIYESLGKLQDQQTKSVASSLAAWSLALFAYLGLLKGVAAGGLEFAENSFGLVAIALVGPTTLWNSATFSKVSYLRAWFSWRFSSSSAGQRATLLLRFPGAFWFFSFLPSNRGFPRYVWPARTQLVQLLPLILVILAMLAYFVGAAALFLALANRVWLSQYPTAIIAQSTVIGSSMLLLLSGTSPFFSDFRRKYIHYGLVDRIGKLSPDDQKSAHRKIAEARMRMGMD